MTTCFLPYPNWSLDSLDATEEDCGQVLSLLVASGFKKADFCKSVFERRKNVFEFWNWIFDPLKILLIVFCYLFTFSIIWIFLQK